MYVRSGSACVLCGSRVLQHFSSLVSTLMNEEIATLVHNFTKAKKRKQPSDPIVLEYSDDILARIKVGLTHVSIREEGEGKLTILYKQSDPMS